jgi:hypothetical protein
MNEAVRVFLLLWAFFAGVLAITFPLVAVIENPRQLRSLNTEGRVVVGILAGVLWPLIGVWGLAVSFAFIGRGFAQLWRFVIPRRVKLPRAQVRK